MKDAEASRGSGGAAAAQSGPTVSSFSPQPSSFASATLAGTIMGTPQFMSPEQARGEVETLDARSDIWSLGAILYQILSLRVPVTGEDAMEVVGKVGRGEIEPLTAAEIVTQRRKGAKDEAGNADGEIGGGQSPGGKSPAGKTFAPSRLCVTHLPGGRIPDSLAAVVRKAMSLDRDARYATVADLQRDIEAYQGGFATGAENAGAWKQLTLFVKRNKAASIGIAAVLLTGTTLGTKAIIEGRRAERGEAQAKHSLAELKKTAPTLLALAETEAGFQRFDSALTKLDAALALDPELNPGYWRRVWLLLGMGHYGEAAAAFRTAQQRDPAQHAHDAFLPVLDAIAAAPDDAARFTAERTAAIFRHFTQVGASGELNALTQRLTLGAKQKEQMVRKRLDEWLGKDVGKVGVNPDGTIRVTWLPKATDTLEPLRGLPIGSIDLGGSAVRSLEPLRGMALTSIGINGTRISDLSPLRGMPLMEMHGDGSDVADLKPLAGIPLRKLSLPQTKIQDISPLRGAPLEDIHVLTNKIVDFSPLRGAPLTRASIGTNQCADLSFLTEARALEFLDCGRNSIADLTPLRGKPLQTLYAERNRITDLRPLAGLPLIELDIYGNPIADYAPLLELRQLQKLRMNDPKGFKGTLEPLRHHPSLQYIAISGGPYRPAAEFWAEYDAQKTK